MTEPDHELRQTTLRDRRRPGRREYRNPALIRLLRGQHAEPLWIDTLDDRDNLRAARGVVLSVAIGLIVWGVVAVTAWAVASAL